MTRGENDAGNRELIIRVADLEVVYGRGASRLKVLDVPSWTVVEGEQVALHGPSGSGKSTLLHVLAGLLLPSAGSVQVAGARLENLGEAARDRFRARHVGYIFQSFNLLEGYTALENVLLGMTFTGKPRRERAAELLGEMDLGRRTSYYPRQLSFGQRQRVAVARALANLPELILADEPTGSLDPRRSGEVLRLMSDACRRHGSSLVVVSHETDVIKAFPRQVPFLELNRAFEAEEAAA
jgi:ABC-type lipoprotein export system ATPase subunit